MILGKELTNSLDNLLWRSLGHSLWYSLETNLGGLS